MNPLQFKYFLPLLSLFCISFLLTNCNKEEDLRQPYIPLIDPEEEPDRLSRHLEIEGIIVEGELPQASPTNDLQITNAQRSAKVSKGSKLYIPFTFSANQPIAGVYLQIIGAAHYWDIPADNLPVGDSYVFAIIIPDRVMQGDFDLKFAVYDHNQNVSRTVDMSTLVANVATACTGGTAYQESGSEGLTVRRLELGETAGTVSVSYYMYQLPDRLDILYNDEWVATTDSILLGPGESPPSSVCYDGTPGYVSGGGTLTFEYDPEINKEFFIYMYGCFGATAWDISVDCLEEDLCQGAVPAELLRPRGAVVPASLEGRYQSTIQVSRGDYVFLSAKGSIWSGNSIRDGVPISNNPSGTALVTASARTTKKYQQYKYGQLICWLNGRAYPFDEYSMHEDTCDNIIDDEFLLDDILLRNEWGNYFIAPYDGFLEFDINLATPLSNAGRFQLEVFTMTQDQHINRNCFNRCPKVEPQGSDTYTAVDSEGITWHKVVKGLGFSFADEIIDNAAENCYHGGQEDYRGPGGEIAGCQCVYDANGDLDNAAASTTMGSFDYGYYADLSDTRLHFILDVLPHLAYLRYNRTLTYAPTPDVNLY